MILTGDGNLPPSIAFTSMVRSPSTVPSLGVGLSALDTGVGGKGICLVEADDELRRRGVISSIVWCTCGKQMAYRACKQNLAQKEGEIKVWIGQGN